jgi:GNAT superfamily N-acetyltransferase
VNPPAAAIRTALPSDLPALAALTAASPLLARYRTTYDGALVSLQDGLAAGDVLLLVGEPPSGFAWLTFAPRMLNGAAYLRLLLVAEGVLGAGLGTRLLLAAEREARERANHLYLLCTTDNTSARRFYERHGYRHVGELPGLVWPDLDEALYHKPLRSTPISAR